MTEGDVADHGAGQLHAVTGGRRAEERGPAVRAQRPSLHLGKKPAPRSTDGSSCARAGRSQSPPRRTFMITCRATASAWRAGSNGSRPWTTGRCSTCLPCNCNTGYVWATILRGSTRLTSCPMLIAFYISALLRSGEKFNATPRIRVSTIHGTKGGEADNVILFTDLSQAALNEYGDDLHRVFYVGVTRTKENLFVVEPEDATRSYML
jgi:hypothetical protein